MRKKKINYSNYHVLNDSYISFAVLSTFHEVFSFNSDREVFSFSFTENSKTCRG